MMAAAAFMVSSFAADPFALPLDGLINVLLFTRGGQKEISWPNVKSVLLGKGGSGEVSRKPVDRKARQIAHPSWCGSCWKELNARKRQQLRKDRGRRSQLWLQLWKGADRHTQSPASPDAVGTRSGQRRVGGCQPLAIRECPKGAWPDRAHGHREGSLSICDQRLYCRTRSNRSGRNSYQFLQLHRSLGQSHLAGGHQQ